MTTILIVDDNRQNLYLLEVLLTAHGYGVKSAINGQEALDAALAASPDLIISDILMPVMDGYTFCKKCQEQERLRAIPFIFYTSTFTERKDEQLALSLGASQFLIKPQEPDVLLRVIEEELATARHRREHRDDSVIRNHEALQEVYRETMLQKLEKKMAHLEQTKIALEQENRERKRAEAALLTLNQTLEARVAERTAQLTEANKALDAFCATVSHDLRTPLANIFGLCQILHDDFAEQCIDEGKELIENILVETHTLLDRIHALLEFSRLNRGGEISHETVDLSSMAHAILQDLQEREPARQVDVTIQEGISVQGDPHLLYTVMSNLLGNAWKYTRKTAAPLIVFGAKKQEEQHVLFVRDNGAGFSMDLVPKLFCMFQRLHSETEFAGDGIGLATVQRIIQRHGGSIWAEAEPGHGATFWFTW
jgi:signal transduction histidine kinase